MRRSHHGITDFEVPNIGEEILRVRREVDKLVANWRTVLSSIARLSLLVGGIGIFSVMQISISERTCEIGLRKSIVATDPEIFGQFLIESVSLSLVGGLLGASLGYGITMLAGQALAGGLAVSPVGLLLAAPFAIAIGLGAGVYPPSRPRACTPSTPSALAETMGRVGWQPGVSPGLSPSAVRVVRGAGSAEKGLVRDGPYGEGPRVRARRT